MHSAKKDIRLRVKVAAGASRDGIDGWLGDTLKLRVTARPERGEANAAVARLIADTIGIPKRRVQIVSGHTSPRKVVELEGVSEPEVRRKLAGGPQQGAALGSTRMGVLP